ncbi:MAG: HD domain-containing protein, partial [Erysipelotrichaceae bacterium]
MVSTTTVTHEMLFKEVKKYMKKNENIEFLEKAYHYAAAAHEGQLRRSGEPYMIHAVQVGYILAQMRTGPKTIAAGLLHDVIEDCTCTSADIINEFGEEVYNLVESVTKIGNLEFSDEKEYLAANHRKIFIAMAK